MEASVLATTRSSGVASLCVPSAPGDEYPTPRDDGSIRRATSTSSAPWRITRTPSQSGAGSLSMFG
jgi:hypothetical protein